MDSRLYIWFILAGSILSALTYFKKGMPLFLQALPVYLLVTFVVELIGQWMNNDGRETITLYNVFVTIEFIFYFWMLQYVIRNHLVRRILRSSLWLYPIVVILNKLFLQKGPQFHTLTVSLGCLLIVIAAITYFFELFQFEKPVDLIREPSFWICSGLLFYYTCIFPLYALINFFRSPSDLVIKIIDSILAIMNIFLYSSFIIAALCRIKITKSLS
ncbi:MAG: hypothetical protein M9933_08525 [Chitinophagaceae bacterium]|nr:hypothetical protein [Chitinophagaceae bacterium]